MEWRKYEGELATLLAGILSREKGTLATLTFKSFLLAATTLGGAWAHLARQVLAAAKARRSAWNTGNAATLFYSLLPEPGTIIVDEAGRAWLYKGFSKTGKGKRLVFERLAEPAPEIALAEVVAR